MKKIKLECLNTKIIGRNAFKYNEIDSTQKEIWRNIDEIENGTLIIANIQTSGIGTHGRTWYTSCKGNIAFSIVIKPDCKACKLTNISISIAEILQKIFYDLYKINISIKSPNDLVVNNKKLGGILAETKLVGEVVKYLVIGIGINTIQKDFEEDIKDIATSIKNEFGIKVQNEKIITEFCNRFEKNIIERMEK